MEENRPMKSDSEKPKKKRVNQGKREGKKRQDNDGQPKQGNTMSSTVQYHPDGTRLAPDGQGTSQARLPNLPPKKSLSPSFLASHGAQLEGNTPHIELTHSQSHTVQHLPKSEGKEQGQSSGERMQFAPDIRLMGQNFPRGPPPSSYRQFAPQGVELGGLLRQQLLQGARANIDPSAPTQTYHRPTIDPPRSSPSYHSPPPNRTVHNIPRASPPSVGDRGRPKTESERMSPYHVSTIRKTPSPAPKHNVSPAASPHYRQDNVEKHNVKPDRPLSTLEEALRMMPPGTNIPPQLLLQLAMVRNEQEQDQSLKSFMGSYEPVYNYPPMQPYPRANYRPDVQVKEPPHKQERPQFISTMLANQVKSRLPPPPSKVNPPHVQPLTVETQMEQGSLPPHLFKVSPRQVSPSSMEKRQVSPSGGMVRQVSPSSGLVRHTAPGGGVPSSQLHYQAFGTIPTSMLQTSVQQSGQMSTALLQPQATTATEVVRRIPSPKPQHRHKDFAQQQMKSQNIHIPENTGPIRQPVIELVKLPISKYPDGKLPTFSASGMTATSNAPHISLQTLASSNINQLPFSQATQSHGVTLATEIPKTTHGVNPFTFPSNPTALISQPKSQPRYEVISPVVQPTEPKRKLSDIEMPQLDRVSPVQRQKSPAKVEMVKMKSPFNMRLQNLSNLPTNSMYRSTFRAHSVAVHRAKAGLITSTAKSLDLLRQNLQKFINKEIDVIVKQYLDTFFKPGIENIKTNNGENSVTDEHVQAVCRQILEEAKKMYITEQSGTVPVRDENTPLPLSTRKRNASDTDSEKSTSLPRKKKGRPPIYSSGRSTPSKPAKANEPVKREGPKWDSNRLVATTKYIMGARANKALGLGATRGRIYIKHPDVFKYCGDQDDKQWLYENHRMPATGGKAYMMLLEDVKDLAEDEEYRNNANVMMDEIIGFAIPDWMTEKVKVQMDALRTDKVKQRSRSTTPSDNQQNTQQDTSKDLPFSNFVSSKDSPQLEKEDLQVSPSGDTEMSFLTGGDTDDQNMNNLSPFNITGGFDDGVSPSASDLDNLEEETTPLSATFEFTK